MLDWTDSQSIQGGLKVIPRLVVHDIHFQFIIIYDTYLLLAIATISSQQNIHDALSTPLSC